MKTKLRSIPLEIIQKALDESTSYESTLIKLGLFKGSMGTLSSMVKEYSLSLENMNINKRKYSYGKANRIHSNAMFCENSTVHNHTIKNRIIQDSLIKYECCSCGISSVYNGKELRLELHHINGKRKDNRLENLQFLCPNCHSQTENYAGKNNSK